MNKIVFSIRIPLFILLFATVQHLSANENTPVAIKFDINSDRIDLITNLKLPDYTKVQRGSIQFFRTRLDSPDNFIDIFHDGVQKVSISSLARMKKVQEKFHIWSLDYTSGRSNHTPRIHHQVISFIPLSSSGKPEQRVYIWLQDLTLIDWSE